MSTREEQDLLQRAADLRAVDEIMVEYHSAAKKGVGHVAMKAFTLAHVLRRRWESTLQAFDELAAQIKKPPTTLADAYQGVWQHAQHYKRGDLCTFRGSLWICVRDSADKPGDTDTWRLCVKHGRDAR